MGYFAILKQTAASEVSLRRCHVNLWCLPSLVPGRQLLYFDLGFEVGADGSEEVQGVDVLLPFRVEEGKKRDLFSGCQDLYSEVSDDRTAELIFGGNVVHLGGTAETGRRLDIGDDEITVARISAKETKPSNDFTAHNDSSLFTIVFESAVPAGESRYFRIRFRVFGERPLWKSKSFLGGAHMDFRISDVRESKYVDHESSLRGRIIPIGQVNFFLMAPDYFQLANCSPDVRYVRVLESRAWQKYVHSAVHRRGKAEFLVYYWRSTKNPVVQDSPFRAFADFNRTPLSSRWSSLIWFALAIFVAIVVVRIASAAIEIFDWSIFKSIWTYLGLATLTGMLTLVAKLKDVLSNRALKPRAHARRLERGVLAILSGSVDS